MQKNQKTSVANAAKQGLILDLLWNHLILQDDMQLLMFYVLQLIYDLHKLLLKSKWLIMS